MRGDGSAFLDVATDRAATAQAFGVTAVASALGQAALEQDPAALVLGAVSGTIGLVAWTALLWTIGRLLGGSARLPGLLRGIGYTAAPFALIGIPVVGTIAVIYSIGLQVIATRRIHAFGITKAMTSVIVPWLLLVLAVALARPGV
jgi:hypothetical protein